MKKSHIVALILIAAAVAAIMSTVAESSTYATFSEAADFKGDKQLHVAGVVSRDKEKVYNPQLNPNLFTFYMKDKDSLEKKVVLNAPPPQDFEKSEQIVLIGKMQNDVFNASSILMKCPSKYNNPQDAAKAVSAK